ncbi:dentin sialophosphoprotein [Spatholobus suberectus]|nr:dentin sialophosphoprotein [Spatholobus suberectus]
MESVRNSGSSADMRTGLSTNSGEGEQFNKEKKQVPSSSPFSSELTSQDHFDFMTNATTTTTHPRPLGATSPIHDQTYLQSELHHTHSVAEKGDGRPVNSHLEAHPANPFGEAHHSPLANNTAPSSSSQNPFLLMSDDTNNTTHMGASESEKVHDHLHPLPAMQQEKGGMTNNSLSKYSADEGLHSTLAPFTNEHSQGNPFKAPTSATSEKTPVGAADFVKADEHHDQGNETHHGLPSEEQGHWSMPSSEARTHPANTHGETHVPSSSQQSDPMFALESAQNQQQADATSKNRAGATTIPTSVEPHHTYSVTEQGHHGKASGNMGADKKLGSSVSSFSPASESSSQDHMHNPANAAPKAPQKRGKDFKLVSESSDDDIPISSFPRHGQQAGDGTGQHSSVAAAPGTSNGSEKQTPPLQVMERPEDPTTSSKYSFPSHVFDRHKSKSKSNTQWSTASNESLFSIQMGNMSFSSDMAWMGKSGDMDKPGDMNSSGAFPSSQPPLPPQPQPPATKFSDISQSTAKQHESSRVTEEKAAETMREVIMENSINKQNISNGDLTTAGGATGSNRCSSSNAHSHCSDASTKSFAFNVMTDGDKTLSPKHGEEKRKQQKQPEQQNLKATPDAAQNPKPTPNTSRNKSWLSCFSCC